MTDNKHPHDLAPLFKKARSEGLWFYTGYQGLWFSPDELEAHQRNVRFCWSAENWKLRHPSEFIEGLKEDVRRANQALEDGEFRVRSHD